MGHGDKLNAKLRVENVKFRTMLITSTEQLTPQYLTEFHAFWWEHPQLGLEIGKLFTQDELNAFVANVEKNVTAFMDFLGDRLSREQRHIYEQLIASRFEVWGRLTDARGLTVTHGDM